MSNGSPRWLKLVLRAERAVGSRVEAAVHSDTYFNVITQTRRSTRRVGNTIENVSKRVLHLANLPAGTDIRRVREQLARMERRMVELSKDLDEHAARQSDMLAVRQPDGQTPFPPAGRPDPRQPDHRDTGPDPTS